MELEDDKKALILRLGIAAWTHWSTLVVPFHFAAWFPKKEICKGIDCFNRGKIKTDLLTFPAAAHASGLPVHYKVYTPANVTHSLYENNECLYKDYWRMREIDHKVTMTAL